MLVVVELAGIVAKKMACCRKFLWNVPDRVIPKIVNGISDRVEKDVLFQGMSMQINVKIKFLIELFLGRYD